MTQESKPRLTIIILASFIFIGFLLGVVIPPENISQRNMDKNILSLALIFFIISIIGTLVIFFCPKLLDVHGESVITGLTVGTGIFTVIFLIRLLFP